MLNELLSKLDYCIFNYRYLLPYNLCIKYSVPSKRLLGYCFNNIDEESITGKVNIIAHMYCYDSTIDMDNLTLLEDCYGPMTRERVRQILCKFVRKYYKEKK